MNNHSLLGADGATHFKIVAVALVAGIVVIAAGIAARPTIGDDLAALTNPGSTTRVHATGPVIRAGKPVIWTSTDAPAIR
jgi:hypothetical protein